MESVFAKESLKDAAVSERRYVIHNYPVKIVQDLRFLL